jgi:hypothetical protein
MTNGHDEVKIITPNSLEKNNEKYDNIILRK